MKYARTVLCGGRFVRVVPTATGFQVQAFVSLETEGKAMAEII